MKPTAGSSDAGGRGLSGAAHGDRERDAILRRLWVRISRAWLDVLIARGTPPGASSTLALRAHQLTSRKTRERLTRSINSILCSADDARRWRLAVAPERVCVQAARAELQAISEFLSGASLVYARGVAMTAQLIRSAESPLFDGREAASAWYWAQHA